MADDDLQGFRKAITTVKNNPLSIVVLVSFLTGTGVTTGINGVSNPRPDPYTGTMAAAANEAARVDRDTERRERKEADSRMAKELQDLATQIAACKDYQNGHRVEFAQLYSQVQQLDKESHRHRYEVAQ